MKKILKSALLIMMGLVMFTSCEDDNDSNPIVKTTTEFRLNTPAMAATNIDLTNSSAIVFTCSQPNYGFPASTMYKVQVSLKEDMTDFVELDQSFPNTVCSVDAAMLASTLTTMELNAGKSEADFPMDVKVYVRMRAYMTTDTGEPVADTEILSNVICLENVHLNYSLAPVTMPEHLYVVGGFCGWDWGNSFEFVPVYEHPEMYWRMVWIDEAGVKINTAKDWDGNQKGYNDITVAGDLAAKISTNDDGKFTVPATMDADFVSPAFTGNTPDGTGVRAYVKIPGNDWWHSEFMVLNGEIAYRGKGGDQDRVAGKVGQKLYLNFYTGKGSLK